MNLSRKKSRSRCAGGPALGRSQELDQMRRRAEILRSRRERRLQSYKSNEASIEATFLEFTVVEFPVFND